MEPWTLKMEAWRLKMEAWKVTDSHHIDNGMDPDQDPN